MYVRLYNYLLSNNDSKTFNKYMKKFLVTKLCLNWEACKCYTVYS